MGLERHTLVLWADTDAPGWLVEWRVDSLDGAETTVIAADVEIVGSTLFKVRALSTALMVAALHGAEAARGRLAELERRSRAAQPALFD